MYVWTCTFIGPHWSVGRFFSCAVYAIRAEAQPPSAPPEHQHEPSAPPQDGGAPAQQHDMQHMHMGEDQDMAMPPVREGSGTSWLPDETPMYPSTAKLANGR